MDFLRACARRLDEGEAAEGVMGSLRERYGTVRCVNVKACQVRQLCVPCPEFLRAINETLETLSDAAVVADLVALRDRGTRPVHPEARLAARGLPPRLRENARQCTVSRAELRACKRAGATRALERNRCVTRVPGRALLAHARRAARDGASAGATRGVAELALCVMVLTGRRECEVLNGRSTLEVHDAYAVRFGGQAKKRRDAPSMLIPTLAPAAEVVALFDALRARQGEGVALTNRETSRRYQSLLSRHLATAAPWTEAVPRPHALRGAYACMALRLFEWGDASDAYVAMSILGHASLEESLVYTTYRLGDDFGSEPRLGVGHLTPPPA